MKSKRLLAALLCVMMMLTIMPVLNVAAATTVTDAQLGLDSATTYTEWNIAANGATLPADGHITGVPAADMVDGIGMGYTEEGMRVVADATATFKDVAVTFDKSPVDNGTAIIFRAKAEGTETIALRNAGEVYIDIKNAAYGGRHTLTGHTIYNDVVFGTNQWTTYLVTQSPLGTGYYLFAKKDGATDWTWCGKFLDHNQGNATQMKFSFDYNKDTTTGVVVSSIKVVDGVKASAVPDPDYTTQADLIPADWTATTDLDLRNITAWPTNDAISFTSSITANDGDDSVEQEALVPTAEGLRIYTPKGTSKFTEIVGTAKGGATINTGRILKFRSKLESGKIYYRFGTSISPCVISQLSAHTDAPGNGWVDYIWKVNADNTGVEIWYDKGDGKGYQLLKTLSGWRNNEGTQHFKISAGNYDHNNDVKLVVSDIEFYEYVEPVITKPLSDLVPAAWGNASHTFDFKNANFDWEDSAYDGFSATTFTGTAGSVTYNADGVKICQDPAEQYSDFVISLDSGHNPISANRIMTARAKVVAGKIYFMLGNSAVTPAMNYEVSAAAYGTDWVNFLFKVNEAQNGIEVWTKSDSDAGYTLKETVTATRNKSTSAMTFSCGYNGKNNSSEAWISDIALYTNPSAGLQEGSNKKTEAEIMPEGWEAWVDWNFTSSFSVSAADAEKATIGGMSATVPTDGSCYAVYTDEGIHAYANTSVQFKDVSFIMTDGADPVSADRIIKFRGRVNDGTLGDTKKTSSIQVRADGSLGRIYQNIWPNRLELRGSDGATDQYTAFLPGSNWVTYIIKLNDAGTKYQLWAKMDADAKYTLIGEDDQYSTHTDGVFALSCGYNGGGTEAWISDFEVWQAPKVVATGTQEEIIGKAYVSDSVDLTQCTGAADDEMVSGQGVTAAKDGVVTYDATNGATVWTTADNYAAGEYGDWQWTNASWLPFSDTYKAIKMVAKAEANGEIQIRAGRGTGKGVFVNIASTYVTTRKPEAGYKVDTHYYDFGTGFNEILIVPGEDGYALWVRPEGSTDKYTQVFADAAYFTDERATFYAGNYKTGTISIKSVEALVGERTGSNILGTNATILENIPLKGDIKASGEIAKYRFAGTSENTWEYSETDGLTFYDDDTENAGTKYVAACYDYSALGGTKALKFTATMEEGGDLKLRIGASGKRAYANMTPSTVEMYSGTSSTPIVAKGVDGNNFAPGTTTQTYLIKTEGNGYAMYVQTDAVNDKWLMIAEADWWRNDGGQMKFETNSGKKVTLKDIVVYETATMAPVTLLDGYTATYVANGGALTDLNNRTVRAIVNPTANGKLVFAGYDADGKMVLANVYTVTAGTKEEKFFAAPKSNANIKTVKVFLWDDFEKMNSQYDMTAVTTR